MGGVHRNASSDSRDSKERIGTIDLFGTTNRTIKKTPVFFLCSMFTIVTVAFVAVVVAVAAVTAY